MTTTPQTTGTPCRTGDWIKIRWHIDDVKEVRPDLTSEQARVVLYHSFRAHDASIGINWDVLSSWAEKLFPASRVTAESDGL